MASPEASAYYATLIHQTFGRRVEEGLLVGAQTIWEAYDDDEVRLAVDYVLKHWSNDFPPAPTVVRDECERVRSAMAEQARREDASGPRLHCPWCQDTGTVECIHPQFVKEYPALADAVEQFGPKWESKAYSTWARPRRQPLTAALNCTCQKAEPRRQRLSEYREAIEEGRPWRKSVPAIQANFDPQRHTRLVDYLPPARIIQGEAHEILASWIGENARRLNRPDYSEIPSVEEDQMRVWRDHAAHEEAQDWLENPPK